MQSKVDHDMLRLHVIAIGGVHQYLHFLPIAFELANRGRVRVTVFTTCENQRDFVHALAERLKYPAPRVCVMEQTWILKRLFGRSKTPLLLWWAARLRNADALYCAERTSSILKRVPGHCPTFIHSLHGFGDRAVGFEERIALFDHVLVAGNKDRDRLIAEGRVEAEHCHVVGPVKLAAIARIELSREPLFTNDRATLVYNPHSDTNLSSFEAIAERLIKEVSASGRYNLIVAPHLKLANDWTDERRAWFKAQALPGRVIVDLDSPRLIDMTYTLQASCYLGDVSSQVYEFLARPRPCLFFDAHNADWIDNPDYAMWSLGPVVKPDANLIASIDKAFATHDRYRDAQLARLSEAIADNPIAHPRAAGEPDDIDRAAVFLERLMGRQSRTSKFLGAR